VKIVQEGGEPKEVSSEEMDIQDVDTQEMDTQKQSVA
jgi:hypothetical protein